MSNIQTLNVNIHSNSITELEKELFNVLTKVGKIDANKYNIIITSPSDNFKKIFTQYTKNDWRKLEKMITKRRFEIVKIDTYLDRFHSYKFIVASVKKDNEANMNGRIIISEY